MRRAKLRKGKPRKGKGRVTWQWAGKDVTKSGNKDFLT